MPDRANPTTAPIERRKNLEVREIFEGAYTLIEPFFEWGGKPLEYLAFQRLNETYPKLSQEDLHILIAAAERVYKERHGHDHAPTK